MFIKKTLNIVLCFFCLFGFIQHSSASLSAYLETGEALKLIGVGVYKELRNDIYVGGLFGPVSVTEATQLVNINVAKRMSVRFISNYSHRQMARYWKEKIALNNPRNIWQPYSKDIVSFTQIFIRNFEKGDELNIDHIPGKGTYFYLNGTLFKVIKNSQLSNFLLNVWIGNNPPTKVFKQAISGLQSSDIKLAMAEKYSLLRSVPGRFDTDLLKIEGIASQKQTNAIVARKKAKKLAAKNLAAKRLAAKKLAAEVLAAEELAAEELAAEELEAKNLAARKQAGKKLAAKKLAAKRLAAKKLAAKRLAAKKLAAKRLANKNSKQKTQEDKRLAAKKAADKKAQKLRCQFLFDCRSKTKK